MQIDLKKKKALLDLSVIFPYIDVINARDSSVSTDEGIDNYELINKIMLKFYLSDPKLKRTAEILHKCVEEDAQLRSGDEDNKWILNEIERLVKNTSQDLDDSDRKEKSTSKNFQDIYLDEKGRIVVNKLGMIFPKKSLVKMDREINMILEEEYLYSSYPVFTMVETTENTVNVEKIYHEFK